MKKVLSMILALVMILSIGTIGVSAYESSDYVWISTSRHGAQIGDFLYFPVFYDDDQYYANYGDENSITKITFPFFYDPEILRPVDVTPSELLYGMNYTGEISTIDVYKHINQSGREIPYPYFYADVTFKGGAEIKKGDILFNIKLEIIGETSPNGSGDIFDSYFIVEDLKNSIRTCAKWEITAGDGRVTELSSLIQHNYRLYPDDTDDNLTLNNYEPFIPPVEEDVPTGNFTKITYISDNYHVRKGDYAYFPVYYDCQTPYNQYAENDSGSHTQIIFPFLYNSNLLKPIEAIPSEQLYNIGGTVKITKIDEYVDEDDFIFEPYIYVEVNFDGCADIVNGVLFNIKFEVISEKFFDEYGRLDMGGLIAPYFIIDVDSNSAWPVCDWKITKSDGTVKDISSYVVPNNVAQFEGTTYEELLLKDYEPFIPPVDCDITEVTYIQQEDTHKDFTVTANGRKSMIQFIEPDGGTRTYDRYNKNVKITSYNTDGEVVNSMARDLAYEVWEIYSNMSVGNEIKVRGKENGKWDAEKYSFTIELYNPIISMELSATSGKNGPVPATVVADEKTEKVMFKMPDNSTVTVASTATDENGNKIFTGNAWMNEDGLNEIRVLIYRNSVWRQVGVLEYTVE